MIIRLFTIAIVWFYTVALLFLMIAVPYFSFFAGSVEREASMVVCYQGVGTPDYDPILSYLDEKGVNEIIVEPVSGIACPHQAMRLAYTEKTGLFWRSSTSETVSALLREHDFEERRFSVAHSPPETPALNTASAALLVLVAGLFLHFQRNRKQYVQPPQRTVSTHRLGWWGLAAGMILFVVMLTVSWAVGMHAAIELPEPPRLGFHTILAFVVLLPIFEEIIFRAWLLEAWRKLMGPAAALLLSAVAFSAIHPMGLLLNLIFIVPGILFGLLWLKHRSLFACSVAHGTYNFAVMATHVWLV